MGKERDRRVSWSRGLQTTVGDTSSSPEDFSTFQDVDTSGGGCDGRKGMVRLARIANEVGILDFDGTNDAASLNSHGSWPLGTVFTVEILFQVDDIASDRFIIGKKTASGTGITIKQTTTSTVVLVVTDSAAATTTLTWTGIAAATVCGLQLVRNGATLTGWLNGTTQTGTMTATTTLATGLASFGVDNGAGWLDGGIDYCRMWNIARTTKRDIYKRLDNPRNKHVLFDWVFTQGTGATPCVLDRSARENHTANVAGTPAWTRAPIAKNPNPIQALAYNVRRNGTRELVILNGGRLHTATVT